jgi:prepilin-type N-terminal cleavage/methylation domain-containing protein
MKPSSISRTRGFTLLETVIAIGVLAVLLTGFMVVFAPAADGIRKSINVQQADRMASALEQELVTLHGAADATTYKTGFNKSFEWIKDSDKVASAVLVYQYRGELGGTLRSNDRTPEAVVSLKDKLPGKDYIVVPMVRRKSDPNFTKDLPAIEGPVYLVKCTQLVFNAGELKLGKLGTIADPKGTSTATITSGTDYPEAVIAFSAEFYQMANKTDAYFNSTAFTSKFSTLKNPVFTRNLAVRR